MLMGFLAVGFSVGFLLGHTQPNTLLGAFGRMFVHLGVKHILNNIAGVFLIGLIMAVFARPVEFAGVLGSTAVINTLLYQSLPIAGLSVTLFAMVSGTVLFLVGAIIEIRRFDSPMTQILVIIAAVAMLLVVGVQYQRQFLHDMGVVFLNQPVRMDSPIYTRNSSLGHIAGFLWGCVAAAASLIVRYRTDIGDYTP